jgi:tellurite resistance-related uncharacterized protein
VPSPSTGLLAAAALALATDGAAPPEAPDLRGTWRMDLRITSNATVPVIGTTQVKSRTILQVTVDGTAAAPQVHTHPCHLHAEPSRAIATTVIPQSFIDALPKKHFAAELTPTEGGWAFHADMKPQPLGYDPAASGGTLPQNGDDPGITDMEGDGKPGGTIHLDVPLIGKIELYVVQQAHTVLDGVWTGADVWEGQATVRRFQQRTIGASNRLFIANAQVTVDPSQSRFRWARVPEGTTCAQLKAGVGAPAGGPF